MKMPFLLLATSLLSFSALAADSMSFGVVVDNLDVHKNTKLHVREYWKSIVNQSVSWSGEVYDVKASRNKVQLLVADKSRPLYKGYNIVVATRDVAAAADLRIGQRVRFTGTLHEYKAEREGAVLELAEAQLGGAEPVVAREPAAKPAPVRNRRPAASAAPDQTPGQTPGQTYGQLPNPEPASPPPSPAPAPAAKPARPQRQPAAQAPSQLPTQSFGDAPAPAPAPGGGGSPSQLPTGE
jgi:hypothetical protein